MSFMEIISRYMIQRYVKFGDGEIWFGKERTDFSFIPVWASELSTNDEEYRWRYCAAVFIAGKKLGYDFVMRHGLPFVKNWVSIAQIGMDWMELFGVGTFMTGETKTEEGLAVIRGKSSLALEMRSRGPHRDPVDFSAGGIIAGALQYYTKKPIYAVETYCMAQEGVRQCVIVHGTRDAAMDYIKRESPDKADYANRTIDAIQRVERELADDKVLSKALLKTADE